MFGPYSVEYGGCRYFGNISLNESYIFSYDDNLYLVDVNSMATHPISPKLANTIGRVAFDSGCLIDESNMLELRKLKLIVSEEAARPEALLEDESSGASKSMEHPVTSILLFLAQECNLRCVYCFGKDGEYAGKGIMSEETAFRAVDWLIANSLSAEKVDICFFGGEPLLNYPVMKEVVPYAREKAAIGGKRVAFNLTTNGTLLTDEIISFLKEEQIVPVVSVDGPPEYHNRQRPFRNGRGSYDRIHANIQELRAVFPHLTARATVHDDADPFRIKQGLEQIGFTACFLVRASPSLLDIQNAATRSEEIEEQAMRRMVAFNRKEIDQLLAAIRKREINRVCPPSLFLPLVAIHSAQKSYHGCAIGKKRVVISVNGDIYPCASFVGQEQMRMGNIAHYQVKGLNEYHQAVVDSLPECKSCWARYFCGGGCFYRSKAYTGDMHRPATLDCIERKEMLKGLIHIYCQLDDHDKEYLKNISQGDNDHQLRSS